jgi:predicted AlkP superfamily phosphohydrolase/phosphomutase/tetratricopeptide (TPR) repeat protein
MATSRAQRILLIGWDAADWKIITPLLDAGQMPALASLIERGCMGNIATLQPPLSPLLWTSIVTGKRADKHGILHFLEPDPQEQASVRPVSSTSRRCKALWNIFTQAGHAAHAIGFYASHPAEPISGVCVSNAFAAGGERLPTDAVHPPSFYERIAELRVEPAEITDTDVAPFIPRLAEIDRAADKRPNRLAESLARAASVQAVLTGILEHEPWGFVAAYFDAIDVVSHHFMPYHPPRRPNVSEQEFERYRHVVAGIYRFHDMMLARVLALIGDDAYVVLVSDHGFHSDHLRPGNETPGASAVDAAAMDAQWHRAHGVLVVAGPGVRRDERIYGATLLDVAPTILTLAGLPVGRDMDGNVLTGVFDHPPEIRAIESWETLPGEAGLHPPGTRTNPFDHARALQHLVELGYLAPGELAGRGAAESALSEADLNLAVSELSAGRAARAVELLEPLQRALADEDERVNAALAEAYLRSGRHSDATALIERIVARDPDAARARIMLADVRLASGQLDAAMDLVRQAAEAAPADPKAHGALGTLQLRQRMPADAERSFRRALELDDADAAAWDGLAVALLQQERHAQAAEAALQAVGLLHHFPAAHLHLGMALAHLGERERALGPLRAAAEMDPSLLDAHRYLATLYRDRGDHPQMMRHKEIAEKLMTALPDARG